jgi:serine/threonine-protein kinase
MTELMFKIANEPAPNICTVNPALPAALAAAVTKALAKNPDIRYETGEAFARDMRQVLAFPEPLRPLFVAPDNPLVSVVENRTEALFMATAKMDTTFSDVSTTSDYGTTVVLPKDVSPSDAVTQPLTIPQRRPS